MHVTLLLMKHSGALLISSLYTGASEWQTRWVSEIVPVKQVTEREHPIKHLLFLSRPDSVFHSHGSLCFRPASRRLPEQIHHPVMSAGRTIQIPQNDVPRLQLAAPPAVVTAVNPARKYSVICCPRVSEEVIAKFWTRPHAVSAVRCEKCFQGENPVMNVLLRYVCMSWEKWWK